MFFDPLQSPEALQEVALSEVQESVAGDPDGMVMGPSEPLAFKSTEGAEGPPKTLTVTLSLTSPSDPVQVSVYPLGLVSEPVGSEPPDMFFDPLQSPEALQKVALSEVQERSAEDPDGMVIGPLEPLAFRSTEGSGGGGAIQSALLAH